MMGWIIGFVIGAILVGILLELVEIKRLKTDRKWRGKHKL